MLRFLRRLHDFEPRTEDALRKFLAVVFRNALLDEIRRVRRRPRHGDERDISDQPDEQPDQLEELLAKSAVDHVERAFRNLQPEHQRLIESRLEGASYASIAAFSKRPSADAARVAVRRAFERLRDLAAQGQGTGAGTTASRRGPSLR